MKTKEEKTMTRIRKVDYENDLTKNASLGSRMHCARVKDLITNFVSNISKIKKNIRTNEFRLEALLKDYDSLLNNSKSFRKSDEIESLEDKIENVRAELCDDTHFVRDVNKLTDFDYYKKQNINF